MLIFAYICLIYLIDTDIDAPRGAAPRISIIYQENIRKISINISISIQDFSTYQYRLLILCLYYLRYISIYQTKSLMQYQIYQIFSLTDSNRYQLFLWLIEGETDWFQWISQYINIYQYISILHTVYQCFQQCKLYQSISNNVNLYQYISNMWQIIQAYIKLTVGVYQSISIIKFYIIQI